ncbi:hypothetical protein GVAV_002251 [Gurleya vavrai]
MNIISCNHEDTLKDLKTKFKKEITDIYFIKTLFDTLCSYYQQENDLKKEIGEFIFMIKSLFDNDDPTKFIDECIKEKINYAKSIPFYHSLKDIIDTKFEEIKKEFLKPCELTEPSKEALLIYLLSKEIESDLGSKRKLVDNSSNQINCDKKQNIQKYSTIEGPDQSNKQLETTSNEIKDNIIILKKITDQSTEALKSVSHSDIFNDNSESKVLGFKEENMKNSESSKKAFNSKILTSEPNNQYLIDKIDEGIKMAEKMLKQLNNYRDGNSNNQYLSDKIDKGIKMAEKMLEQLNNYRDGNSNNQYLSDKIDEGIKMAKKTLKHLNSNRDGNFNNQYLIDKIYEGIKMFREILEHLNYNCDGNSNNHGPNPRVINNITGNGHHFYYCANSN